MGETDNYRRCLKFSWFSGYYHRFAKPKKLVSAPILVLPESSKHFILYIDAFCVGLSYVFIKEGRVISYASRKLRLRRIILHMT